MAEIVKPIALGDVILYEAPMHYCRCDHEVTRELAATVGLVAGQAMDFTAAAAAAVQTATAPAGAPVADGGTYRLGFRGLWTAPIAWNANAAACKIAFELISGGVLVTFSAAACITGSTCTFANTVGNVEDILFDARLLLDGAVAMTGIVFATTTAGELATMKEWATTTANADSILLEPVTLADLQGASGQSLRRSFLTRGPSVVNADAVTCPAGTVAALVAALLALGIVSQREPTDTTTGTPRA